MTFAELVQAWHAEKSKTARTADELRDKMLHYAGKLATRPADEVAREDIGRIHHEIATKARKRVYKRIDGEIVPVEIGEPGLPATADKWRAAVSAVFAWGEHKGLVRENPAAGIQQAFDSRGAARTRYLRGDELLRFWRALEADSDGDTRDAIKLLLFTGYPVYLCDHMPTIAANAHPVLFRNFRRGYLLADRGPLRITPDNITNVGFVRFYVRARYFGCILNNNAIKCLKVMA